ncbi:MAG: hypothetical protein INH41_07330 [Myxococcaceae bacterium]|nr:hypothetical protein [Myxococcaceae bacterium]MCA3012198.1 hypothetical protein [Myxococcaceae bacterium]
MHPLWRAVTQAAPWLDQAVDARVPLDLAHDDELALALRLAARFAQHHPRAPAAAEVRAAIADAQRFLSTPPKDLPSIRHPMLPGTPGVDALTRAIREVGAHRHRLPGASRRAARHVVALVFRLESQRPRAHALAHAFLGDARALELRRRFWSAFPELVIGAFDVRYRARWPRASARCGLWVVELSHERFATFRHGRRQRRVDVGDLDSALAVLPAHLFRAGVSGVLQARRTADPLRKDRSPPF